MKETAAFIDPTARPAVPRLPGHGRAWRPRASPELHPFPMQFDRNCDRLLRCGAARWLGPSAADGRNPRVDSSHRTEHAMMRLLLILLAAAMLLDGSGGGRALAQETAERPRAFTLGPGDKIRVTVFGEQSVNGEYTVGPDGAVAFPLIGAVAARGRTIAELQVAITQKLAAGYMLDPRVSIDVLNYRPFYILGEVNRPGQYPYADGLSVAQAVATAGGYTYRARTSRVFIRRADRPTEEEMTLKGGRQVWVMPGDTVRVGERYF